MQAVVQIGSSQYFVTLGQEISIPIQKDNKDLIFNQVCLVIDGDQIRLGKPYLPDYTIKAEKIEEYSGDKLRIFKYKSKSRYRKTSGFRSKIWKVKVTGIGDQTQSSKPLKKRIRETKKLTSVKK